MTATHLGPVISRRKLFAVTGVVSVAAALPVTRPAPAAASPVAAAGWSAAAPGVEVSTLPRLWGTPTDLARTRTEAVFARAADGVVHRYDRAAGIWTPDARLDWPAVVAGGSPHLARWGRSPDRQLVLVLGEGTPPPPTTGPTTPDPTPTSTSTGSAGTTGTTGTTTGPTGTPTVPDRTSAAAAAGTTGRRPGGPLAWTGMPLGAIALTGLAAIGAGAALTLRRRRGAPPAHAGEITDPPPESPNG